MAKQPKSKKAFVCTECGADFPRWQGQCTECKTWNTITEIDIKPISQNSSPNVSIGYAGVSTSEVVTLEDVDISELPRFSTGFTEFDRVLGGGIVAGSAILIGGNPGAGKSTLLLQTMCGLATTMPALYVTGEESLQQVAMRARRLNLPTSNLKLLTETNVEKIGKIALEIQPKIIVIDSIQVMYTENSTSASGSVSQVRESASWLTRFAKQNNIAIFMVGHVTKEGSLAGPKVLEHCVDASILIEGSSDSRYRTLRGQKNRFGAVNELGVFAMTGEGMKEVSNPSAIFLSRTQEPAAGSIVLVIWEGTRPLLVELQALVDSSQGGNPRRVAVGLDQNRLSMLLAIIHRHAGIAMFDQDVFSNVVGGIKINETGADLALLIAMYSSFRSIILPQNLVVFGEVGLSGEIRPVLNGQERITEASKHGFTKAIVPIGNKPKKKIKDMEIIGVKTLAEAIEQI